MRGVRGGARIAGTLRNHGREPRRALRIAGTTPVGFAIVGNIGQTREAPERNGATRVAASPVVRCDVASVRSALQAVTAAALRDLPEGESAPDQPAAVRNASRSRSPTAREANPCAPTRPRGTISWIEFVTNASRARSRS